MSNNKHGWTCAGFSKDPALSVWKTIMRKSFLPGARGYRSVGALGCGAPVHWRDMAAFIKDVGDRPNRLWLLRKDITLPYSKENCYWGNPKDFQKEKPRPENIHGVIGKKYGKWTPISYFNKGKRRFYVCRCDCGNVFDVNSSSLKSLDSTQCRLCGQFKITKSTKERYQSEWSLIKDSFIGRTFGEWTIIGTLEESKGGKHIFICQCSCGNQKEMQRGSFFYGNSKMCIICSKRKRY